MIRDFENLRIEVLTLPIKTSAILASFTVKQTFREKIVAVPKDDLFLKKIRAGVGMKRKRFEMEEDKSLIFKDQLWVPKDEVLRNEIMTKAHSAPYVAHLKHIKI